MLVCMDEHVQFIEDSATYPAALPALIQHQYCPVLLSHVGADRAFPSLGYSWYYDAAILKTFSCGDKNVYMGNGPLLLIDPRGLVPCSMTQCSNTSSIALWDDCPDSYPFKRFIGTIEGLGLQVGFTHQLGGEKHSTMRSWYTSFQAFYIHEVMNLHSKIHYSAHCAVGQCKKGPLNACTPIFTA